MGVGGDLRGDAAMNQSILQILKDAIGAWLQEQGGIAGPFIDYTKENTPCVGLFPTGEQRIGADWAGKERWSYDFTIQLVQDAFEEQQRLDSEALAESFSRWAQKISMEGLELGECGSFESLWAGNGHLLYPAQDGQSFVYEWTGKLCYRRQAAQKQARPRWLFGFGPGEERSWLECAQGICRMTRQEMQADGFLFDFFGRPFPADALRQTDRQIDFSGWVCAEDPFQQAALRMREPQQVSWVYYTGPAPAQGAPARGGECLLCAWEKTAQGPEEPPEIQIRIFLLSETKGHFWQEENETGFFLPDYPVGEGGRI